MRLGHVHNCELITCSMTSKMIHIQHGGRTVVIWESGRITGGIL